MTESAQAPARGNMPPVFVISLARATERRAAIAQRLNAEGIKFEFVDAVDGAKINAADYADRFKEQEHTGYKKMTMGELGCYLSHYNLWERIAREKIPYALILEDDAVWNEDFARVACDIVASEWDWDVTLLYANDRRGGARRLFGSLAGGKYSFRQGIRHTLGAVAYCVTDSAAKRLCAALYQMRDPVDTAWRYYWRWGGRFYTVYPSVADISGAESTIEIVAAETKTKRPPMRLNFWGKLQMTLAGKKRRALFWWHYLACRPRKKTKKS